MPEVIKLKKGLNIRLKGEADKILSPPVKAVRYAVRPVDFHGLTPRLLVRAGDSVKAGSPVVEDKFTPELRLTSPVSGTVKEIVRGERRRLLEIVIEAVGDEYIDFGKGDPAAMSREEIEKRMLESGVWPVIRQRPYHIVARPGVKPKSIFISGFDTAPLAPDYDFIMHNSDCSLFNKGIEVLTRLTDGDVNLVLDGSNVSGSVMKGIGGVKIHFVKGPHPAGNSGVHIHHIDPVNKGETVWYLNLQDVIVTGALFSEGRYRNDRIIALAGSEVMKSGYHRIRCGASIEGLVKGKLRDGGGDLRYISGNVLTGSAIAADGFLGFYDNMITVIPEGNRYEFMGWLEPGLNKYSATRSFLSTLLPGKKFIMDTNYHGGERAFVFTGDYERVLPMDIFPKHLLKAILVGDIDKMEQLGIYEVAEEDFALCEFVCPSKIEVQTIIRKGLEMMIKEMS